MARVQKAVLDLPWREDRRLTLTGVQATDGPILLPSLHQGLLCPTRRLCSPTPAPAPKSSKKPKMQATEDMFPSDWSPPPVEFLNLRAAKANRGALARRQAGALGPPGLRTLARQLPREAEQDPRDSDPEGDPSSLGELFWNVACTSPKAAAPGMNTRTSFPSGGAECYVNSLDYLLWEKREQALEQEQEELLLRDCPDLNSLDLSDDEAPLTPEYSRGCGAGAAVWPSPASLQAADQVQLLTPGSSASCFARKLVERFSTSLQVIPPVHPGEAVFLPRNQPLPCILDCSHLKPRSHLEELFLSSPLAQQLSFLRSGILSSLYLHAGECPVPLLRWLFQSVFPGITGEPSLGFSFPPVGTETGQQNAMPKLYWFAALDVALGVERYRGSREQQEHRQGDGESGAEREVRLDVRGQILEDSGAIAGIVKLC
ncbi:hypothetical protein CB1_000321015 [Camelus ferus]|nr:hypothetical protein CB1_000321015 [Camelus ferus]